MTQTIISNEDIRGIVRERIQHLWCQHCRAMQKTNDTVVECWYNPLDYDRAFAFCAANEDAIDAILKLSNLAVVDRDAELPENPIKDIYPVNELTDMQKARGRGIEQGQQDMVIKGWVKECL